MRYWLTLIAALALVACRPAPEPAEPPAPSPAEVLATTCRVCAVDRGEPHPEYLPSRLNLERDGVTYRFCADECRRKFEAAPDKYTLVTSPAAEEG